MSDISDKFFVEEIERLKSENFELKNSRNPFTLNFVGFEECVIGTKYIIEFTANGFKVEKYEEEMEQTNKERFLELLRKVNRNGMDKLIEWLEKSTFFVDPASAKYHGDYEGGLCDHSLAVFEEYVKLTGTDYEDEKAIITCLLHDVCKIGTYKLGFRNVKNADGKCEQVPQYENQESGFPFGHGEKSVLMISSFIKLTKEEILMIRWHMGAYESKECWRELGEAQEMYPSVLYIHFADMLATKVRGV